MLCVNQAKLVCNYRILDKLDVTIDLRATVVDLVKDNAEQLAVEGNIDQPLHDILLYLMMLCDGQYTTKRTLTNTYTVYGRHIKGRGPSVEPVCVELSLVAQASAHCSRGRAQLILRLGNAAILLICSLLFSLELLVGRISSGDAAKADVVEGKEGGERGVVHHAAGSSAANSTTPDIMRTFIIQFTYQRISHHTPCIAPKNCSPSMFGECTKEGKCSRTARQCLLQ